MRCELPTPRRCCFCIPLRIGLLIAGYIKIILSTLFLLYNFLDLYYTSQNLESSEHYVIALINLFSCLNSIADVVFHIIFLIAAHKKDYRKIRWYYRYSIYSIIAFTIYFFMDLGMYLKGLIFFIFLRYIIVELLIYIWILVVQIYLLILVRSEFLKLKDNTKFQFVNTEAEAQCSATIKIPSEVDEVDDNNDEVGYDKISV